MGREFTNALASIPLWQFALLVYPKHQNELLRWQNDNNLSVNYLLAFAFGLSHGVSLPIDFYQRNALERQRLLIRRARALRLTVVEPLYDQAKYLELMLEGIEIQQLQAMFEVGDISNNIENYEKLTGTKKGALAPFIKSLLN
jgi:hypothetical protein